MTDKDDAVAAYTREEIRRSGYDATIDDKVYQYRGVWGDRPSIASLDVGNLVLIEDYPLYVGSVWKKVASDAPIILPIAGLQAIGINITEIETFDDGSEQEVFDFGVLNDAYLVGTFIKFLFQGQKSTNSIGGTLRLYAEYYNTPVRQLLQTISIPALDRRVSKEYVLKFTSGDETHDLGLNILDHNPDDLTLPYPNTQMLPQPPAPDEKYLRFALTFQSDSVGQVFTLKHGNSIWYSV